MTEDIKPNTQSPSRHIDEQLLCDEVGFESPWNYNAARILFDNLSAERGDRIAIITDRGTWTYAALCAEANRIGNALLGQGLRAGDRVVLLLDDEPAYPAAVMGAMRAGLVPVLINTLSTADLLRFYVEDSEAKAAVISAPHGELILRAGIGRTSCRTVISAGEPTGEILGWGTVEAASAQLDEAPTTREDMAFWMYSSGSTGRPKGVVHRHEDLLYTHKSYAENVLKLRPDDICFSVPKIFFAYGFGNSVTFPFCVGAATVLMAERPEPARVFEQIAKHRPTVFFGLPTLYTALVHHPDAANSDLSSLQLCISAAEILSADVFNGWKDRSGLEIVEGLGSTEVLHIYVSNDQQAHKLGSAGRRVPGYAIRLRNPDGRDVADGEEGVLEVLGTSNATQYWNRPDKTAETMRDGWIWTGDRFIRDSDGFYFFKGRADDLVKVSGQWVWPLEIEGALAEHPKVKECAVLAVQMADQRMTIVAFVAPVAPLAPESSTDALDAELKAYAKQQLLPYKYPRTIHFLDALPKTGTDKVDRQALKAMTASVAT